jgi:hypothetical protein
MGKSKTERRKRERTKTKDDPSGTQQWREPEAVQTLNQIGTALSAFVSQQARRCSVFLAFVLSDSLSGSMLRTLDFHSIAYRCRPCHSECVCTNMCL